jgi:dihydroorotate dehydrogenase
VYSLLKKILFCLPPETAHAVALNSLQWLHRLHLTAFIARPFSQPVRVMGLDFSRPIGLAAGLDKNGDYIDALAALGFGFIEVGTVTPLPQKGNPKPRLFRLPQREALINRLGFNNKGVDYLLKNLQRMHYRGVLGVNIGKNRTTALTDAVEDYRYCFRRVADYASYVTINISSPNTPELRELQHGKLLQNLLQALKQEQSIAKKYVPIVVKISPDLTEEELCEMTEVFLAEKIDGVIATNTTVRRDGVEHAKYSTEIGGLSGKPLALRATQVVRQLRDLLQDTIPIIACGGIFSAADAQEKIAAGASLTQVYTGFIYRGQAVLE